MTQLISFILSFLLSVASTALVIKVYTHFGWLDYPDKSDDLKVKQTHQQPVPRGGGVPIFLSFLICSLIFLQFDKYLIAIIISALLLTITGVLDDIFNLNPFLRLGVGIVSALIVVGAGIGIAFVTNPFGSGVIHLNQPQIALYIFGGLHTIWILADLFALLFITWNMNAVNWAKGVDGQLPAFVSMAFLFIGLFSSHFSADPTQFSNSILSFILAGSFLGLLVYNWYPQKIMPGYGGGSLAGFFLSILAIISGAKIATTLMVLAIPTADGLFTIGRRLRAGKSPFWGDRGHLHHKLLDEFGWGKRRIAFFYSLASLIMGMLALTLQTRGKIISLLISFSIIFSLLIWAKLKQINRQD